jgi:nucleolar pre-ribosomal-associated protein 1
VQKANTTIQNSEFQEQAQTLYILNMLSRLYGAKTTKTGNEHQSSVSKTTEPTPRLSSFTTLFFAYAIRALYMPASILYPLTSRFLLQRPEFDPLDPPMLYSMLYSGLESDFGSKEGNWKRERNWMLKFLADAMVGSRDWIVLQRRHTWDLLSTMFQANRSDKSLVLSISKVSTHCSKIQLQTVLIVVP